VYCCEISSEIRFIINNYNFFDIFFADFFGLDKIFIIFLELVFEALAMSKTNSIPNYFLKLIPERKGRLMDSRTHTDSDGTTINPSCHVKFCCSSMSLYGAKSSDLFLNKTIQLNCARSRCAASATDDITGEFESFFGSVVKLSVFINYK